ncbi:MAG: glycosyltransferase, partial [Gammaproteobacteria bacterium]|nr:glycosyltransferase [Gammaproteobacteria bacterium]
MRVIGIGLNKTGTTSLGIALELLGFTQHQSWNTDKVIDYASGNIDKMLKFTENYNNLEDMPWFLIYKELDEYYDDAMFVLTTRKTDEIWYKSQCKHYDKNMALEGYKEETPITNKIVYGYENPNEHKKAYIEKYNQHNQEVRAYFQGKDNFIEMCFENGDGWEKLCHFLGKDIPNIPFPNLNKAQKSMNANFPTVAVITTTIGKESLHRCLQSVKNQSYPVKHHIYINGAEYEQTTREILQHYTDIDIILISEHTDSLLINRYACQTIEADILCFLNEDNCYEHNHIETITTAFYQEPDTDIAYVNRRYFDKQEQIICDDNTDS